MLRAQHKSGSRKTGEVNEVFLWKPSLTPPYTILVGSLGACPMAHCFSRLSYHISESTASCQMYMHTHLNIPCVHVHSTFMGTFHVCVYILRSCAYPTFVCTFHIHTCIHAHESIPHSYGHSVFQWKFHKGRDICLFYLQVYASA